jgi:hypothetical protein
MKDRQNQSKRLLGCFLIYIISMCIKINENSIEEANSNLTQNIMLIEVERHKKESISNYQLLRLYKL